MRRCLYYSSVYVRHSAHVRAVRRAVCRLCAATLRGGRQDPGGRQLHDAVHGRVRAERRKPELLRAQAQPGELHVRADVRGADRRERVGPSVCGGRLGC